ncbi:LysE family translocator [Desulfohalobium retbaense]|mgnify:FL=1|uniref:Lysine exporter protein (LYSE/YGGA) n=1 Tax=Desulfohalobium retbaense (strain ATCC 49708 / DSM 5692 / JCM 16813 / HR100) TaxID=485915 RepID=C8X225_DESRD|nr:LysE family translocator [Desulfohalobium retbaense]ACV68348.1 Lysine exporter protein (LYSE/YGGA) [Desulfohalobium retbaense DSM 5692]
MFLEIFGLGLLVGMAPGPDFFLVLKNALQGGRAKGRATALGIGCGLLVHVAYSVFGLALLLQRSPALFQTVQTAGGAYLLWLAFQTLRSSVAPETKAPAGLRRQQPRESGAASTVRAGFWEGFLCNLLNPKAALFFISVFSNYITAGASFGVHWIYGLEIVLAVTLWFLFLARVAASDRFRGFYLFAHLWVDRAFGVLLAYLGLGLLWP